MVGMITGGCRCGACRYTLELETLPPVYACHCHICQRFSGSAFSVQALVREDTLTVTGPIIIYEKVTEDRTSVQRYCGQCYSRIYNTNTRRPGIAVVRAGTLDRSEELRCRAHIFTNYKPGLGGTGPRRPAMGRGGGAGRVHRRSHAMKAAAILVPVGLALASCQPNPRNEIAAIAEAAMTQAVADAPGKRLCVERAIAPWQPAAHAHRVDTPAPPGFAPLRGDQAFRGGGGLKGDKVAGVTVREGADCFQLRGPLIAGEQAMLEVGQPGIGWNVWLHRTEADWRIVMTTTSVYPNGR